MQQQQKQLQSARLFPNLEYFLLDCKHVLFVPSGGVVLDLHFLVAHLAVARNGGWWGQRLKYLWSYIVCMLRSRPFLREDSAFLVRLSKIFQ